MKNPYFPPSSSTDLERSDTLVQRARTTICVIAFVALLLDVFIMLLLGGIRAAIVGRMVVTTFLLYRVYARSRWAQKLSIVLFVLIALLNTKELPRLGWSLWAALDVTWVAFHLCSAAILATSPAISALLVPPGRNFVHRAEPARGEDGSANGAREHGD